MVYCVNTEFESYLTPRNWCLSDTAGLIHIGAHRVCQYPQGMPKSKLDKIWKWKKEQSSIFFSFWHISDTFIFTDCSHLINTKFLSMGVALPL